MKKATELKNYKIKMTKHQTNEEKEFEQLLIKNKINYKKQVILGFYIIDFILTDKLVAVEVDGLYHNDKKQIFKDNLRTLFIEKCSLKVIRIKNQDIKTFNIEKLKELPDYTEKDFRRVLSMGNVYKSQELLKLRKEKYGQKTL